MSDPRAPHAALSAWKALRASGAAHGALVTLVRADGGAARSLGTHLALADDGRTFGSVTVGGCADGRALEAAGRVLSSGVPEQLTVPMSEADALALGLGCAGDVDLLVERVSMEPADGIGQAFDAAVTASGQGMRAILLAPLSTGVRGRLLVRADGVRAGGTGDVARDERVTSLAMATMSRDGLAGIRELDGDRWFLQPLASPRTLLVVGATEVAAALCALVAPLGWRLVLLDPRDEVLSQARFALAAERVPSIPVEQVRGRLQGTDAPAVVVVAHDYRVELPVLHAALTSDSPYVGMLGAGAAAQRCGRCLSRTGCRRTGSPGCGRRSGWRSVPRVRRRSR